jgi:hypothetical protein
MCLDGRTSDRDTRDMGRRIILFRRRRPTLHHLHVVAAADQHYRFLFFKISSVT